MRRIILMLTVSALLVAMVAYAGPASAQGGVRASVIALLRMPKNSNLSDRVLLAMRPR